MNYSFQLRYQTLEKPAQPENSAEPQEAVPTKEPVQPEDEEDLIKLLATKGEDAVESPQAADRLQGPTRNLTIRNKFPVKTSASGSTEEQPWSPYEVEFKWMTLWAPFKIYDESVVRGNMLGNILCENTIQHIKLCLYVVLLAIAALVIWLFSRPSDKCKRTKENASFVRCPNRIEAIHGSNRHHLESIVPTEERASKQAIRGLQSSARSPCIRLDTTASVDVDYVLTQSTLPVVFISLYPHFYSQ